MRKIYAAFFLLFLLIAPALASAEVRYVRAGATGSGSGTDWANALPSMPATFVRGDTYYIADGNYGSVRFNTPVSGSTLITLKKATPADHGTGAGWSDSYGDGFAKFPQWAFYTGYYHIDGVTGGGPAAWTSGHGFAVAIATNTSSKLLTVNANNISNITIKHTRFSYEYNRGMSYRNDSIATGQDALYNASYSGMVNWTFQYCYFERPGRTHFLTRGNGHKNWVVEYSYLEKSGHGRGAQHSEIWSHFKQLDSMETGTVTDVTIRYNYILDFVSTGGFMFAGGTNIQVYGNVFRWSGNWGATANNGALGNWTGYGNTSWKVYNNTFIDLAGGGAGKLAPIGNNSGTAYNNIWWNSSVGFGISHNYNLFQGSNTYGEANGQASSSNPFVGGTDYRLKGDTSPGATLGSPYNFDGLQGVNRSSWDRGAFEYNGSGGSAVIPSAPGNLTVN